jgi:exopolyphosphatase / guanosine-5'-triphosphate,3'-diphosphate pyrophosphatase
VRVAVVDLGTNSTRLLVADVSGDEVRELDRRTNVTRLGEKVDSTGRLDAGAMERVFATVAEYLDAIKAQGASTIVALATSAVRDADNGEQFQRELADRFGLEVEIIPGETEARLSFLGATSARPRDGRQTMVLDIGGGSTEFVIGAPSDEPEFHVSTRAGSVRQTERHIEHDPPEPDEVERLTAEVRAIIRADVPEEVRSSTVSGIAVAGTATSLAAIDQDLEPYDPERVHGYRLDLAACERMLATLAGLPLAERREVRGLHPDRAPTIVAGAVILAEAMKAFSFDAMEISEADILHGAALTRARAGGAGGNQDARPD